MTLLERLAGPPSRRAGIIAAVVAAAVMLIGVVLIPTLTGLPAAGGEVIVTSDTAIVADGQLLAANRALLLGNALAFVGFVPLLTAVHAVIGRRAAPVSLLLAAYLVLFIRPLALVTEAAALPGSVLVPLGPLVPWVLLATSGVAAGLAAAAILPLAQSAASPGRRAAVAIGVGLLVALALFSFAPYIAPLSALGVAVALSLRRGPDGPAGQD